MPDAYGQLLDAVISHLEDMKARGISYVGVSAETLSELQNFPKRTKDSKPPFQAPAPGVTPSPAPLKISSSTAPVAERSVDKGKVALFDLAFEKGAPSPGPSLDPSTKATVFASLRQRAMACVKCSHLASSRKNVVFGVGNINSELMFVGEAPGADEDAQGEPFVGRAGQLLTRIIETMGLTRDSVYIANILKCRPDTPGQTAGNGEIAPHVLAIRSLRESEATVSPIVKTARAQPKPSASASPSHPVIRRLRSPSIM